MIVVLAYRRKTRTTIDGPDEFADDDFAGAMARRLALELKYRTDEDVEVPLLGAASIDHMKVTHGRYFEAA